MYIAGGPPPGSLGAGAYLGISMIPDVQTGKLSCGWQEPVMLPATSTSSNVATEGLVSARKGCGCGVCRMWV